VGPNCARKPSETTRPLSPIARNVLDADALIEDGEWIRFDRRQNHAVLVCETLDRARITARREDVVSTLWLCHLPERGVPNLPQSLYFHTVTGHR
jgi:hypothetical protein